MKKSRLLAIALVVAVMLVGAGYAAWTDKLTITNTVSTGELDVDFGEYTIYKTVFGIPIPWEYLVTPSVKLAERDYSRRDIDPTDPVETDEKLIKESSYASSGLGTWDEKTINVTFEKLYPGTLGMVTAVARNNGTIPAVYNNVEVAFDGDQSINLEKMKDRLMCAGGIVLHDKDGYEIPGSGKSFYGKTLRELQTELNTLLSGVRLEKDQYIVFDIPEEDKAAIAENVEAYDPETMNCLLFYLPSNTDNGLPNDQTVENSKVKFSIKINWKQHN